MIFKSFLTKAPIAGQLLVNLLHSLDVYPAGLSVINHGFGVVHSNYALSDLLNTFWGIPRVIDEFGREAPQYGQIAPVIIIIKKKLSKTMISVLKIFN